MLEKRASGILLHVSSLPAKDGIGDLGPEAFKFVDILAKSGQSCWQVLPLNHTCAQNGHSPYSCSSAFAGNPLLISIELLHRDGLLKKTELNTRPVFSQNRVDFDKVSAFKNRLLKLAFSRFKKSKTSGYEKFKRENHSWLDDFAFFITLQKHFDGESWNTWPRQIKERNKAALNEICKTLKDEIEYHNFLQYVFYKQWMDLKRYCNRKGIAIFGDIPIYVTYESPDVWSHPELFKLGRDLRPKYVAGVPPDYFSRTGQLWRNPVYDWNRLKKSGYRLWMQRIGHNLKLFDFVRIDHFRGLCAYWQVPASHKTAQKGKWVKGPGEDFFKTLFRNFPDAPIIAEDLGHITPDVRRLIEKFDIPNMKVLQFAFPGKPAKNTHIPHNHKPNSIVYTGTHDNNTIRGWFENEADKKQKALLSEYLGQAVSAKTVNRQMIRLAMGSVAKLAIIPAQDILDLPQSARMNLPNSKKGNWLWRLLPSQLTPAISAELMRLTRIFARD